MLKYLIVNFACLTVLVGSSAAQEQKEEHPEPKAVATPVQWEAGERFKCVIKDEATGRTTSGSGEEFFEISSTLIMDTNWEMTKILPDGGVEFTVGIERLQFSANGDGAAAMVKDLTFDSRAEAGPEDKLNQGVASVLKRYAGPVARGRLDARGQVKFFSFTDEISAMFEEQVTRELGGFFSGHFTPGGLRFHLVHWLASLPSEELTKGRTWTQENISRGGPRIISRRSYEVVKEEDRNGAPHFEIRISPEYVVKSPIEVTRQAGSGTVYRDSGTRRISEFSLQHKALISTGFSTTSVDFKYSAKVTGDSP